MKKPTVSFNKLITMIDKSLWSVKNLFTSHKSPDPPFGYPDVWPPKSKLYTCSLVLGKVTSEKRPNKKVMTDKNIQTQVYHDYCVILA